MAAKFHFRPTWGFQDRRLSKEAIVLQDYLGRCPTRVSEGLFALALGYVVVDTPLSEAEVRSAFAELSKAGLYEYDADSEVVLDRTALRVNPLRNPRDKETDEVVLNEKGEPKRDKRIPNAVRMFEALPDSRLKPTFVALADRYSPDLADAIRADSIYAYSSPSGGPSKDHASTIEGASREETSSYEERPSRNEQRTEDTPSAIRHLKESPGEDEALALLEHELGADVVEVRPND